MGGSFEEDLADDLSQVFFDSAEFGCNALLGSDQRGISCFVDRGIERVISDRYIKAAYEIKFQRKDGARKGDLLLVLNDDGLPVAKYEVGEILVSESDTVIREGIKRELP